MSGDYLDVVAVREAASAPCGETTAVRLLGLLPPHWICVPLVERDRVRLRILLAGTGGSGAVRGAVAEVLADSALRGWHEADRADRADRAGWTDRVGRTDRA